MRRIAAGGQIRLNKPGFDASDEKLIMKMKLWKPVLAAAGASFLLTGCVVRERTVYRTAPPPPAGAEVETSSEVVVDSDMPTAPPPGEVVVTEVDAGPPPFVGGVWIGPAWGWGPGGWAWHRGYWDHPHPGMRWYGPRYMVRGGRRVYVRGGWRR